MQCVILCGGLGTRLREETEFRPKPMVKIGERPILWHIMKGYAAHGVTDFILVLGYRGDMIKDYFLSYEALNNDFTLTLGDADSIVCHDSHDESGWTVTLADTGQHTLKGGRLKKIEKYIKGDTFLVTYGDGVSDVDIGKLIAFHKDHGKTVSVTGVNPASRFGELKMDGAKVRAFSEKPEAGKEYVSGGFFVFDKSILNGLTPDEDCDLEYGLLEDLSHQGDMMAYRHDGFWSCMDNVRDVEYLNGLWDSGKAPWKTW